MLNINDFTGIFEVHDGGWPRKNMETNQVETGKPELILRLDLHPVGPLRHSKHSWAHVLHQCPSYLQILPVQKDLV